MKYKYIFCAGAPGSKWSSLIKNIYYSADIDQSDYSESRTYYHDAPGTMQLMHLGAYYDPGMEFGDFFDNLSDYSKEECEREFDRAFLGTSDRGIRIIKSHVFAHHIDYIKATWPECPMILALRDNDACLGWWVRCGHFNITYPSYHKYYKNLREMARIIDHQNRDIRLAWDCHDGIVARNNQELAGILDIQTPPEEYTQNYAESDLEVKVI
jgi:hypothetical protein